MPDQLLKGFGVGLLILTIVGCSSKRQGVSARAYYVDKERVDQSMEGNLGYLQGSAIQEDRKDHKKTRRIYVLEFSKENGKEGEDLDLDLPERKKYQPDMRETIESPVLKSNIEEKSRPLVIPSFDDISFEDQDLDDAREAGAFIDYTVQKDDTLQKISKKFYDTYRRWPEIYEANRDVLKDPNSVRPGVVIRVPSD